MNQVCPCVLQRSCCWNANYSGNSQTNKFQTLGEEEGEKDRCARERNPGIEDLDGNLAVALSLMEISFS